MKVECIHFGEWSTAIKLAKKKGNVTSFIQKMMALGYYSQLLRILMCMYFFFNSQMFEVQVDNRNATCSEMKERIFSFLFVFV